MQCNNNEIIAYRANDLFTVQFLSSYLKCSILFYYRNQMQRGPDLVCPFCNCVFRNIFTAQRHIGTGLNSCRCPLRVEWDNRVECPGGAPTCRVPIKLLTSGIHSPTQCLARYQEYQDLCQYFPRLGPYKSLWFSGTIKESPRPRSPSPSSSTKEE